MKNKIAILCLTASIAYGQSVGPKALVLEKTRAKSALGCHAIEFILMVTPESAGSQHLVLGTQTIPPGGKVPKHRHLNQDEVVVLQSGSARMTLAGKDYDVHAGGIVFAPANTWMALENTGTEDIQLIFIYSAPGFERYMRCTSTPVGQTAPPLSLDQLRACAEDGHVEYQDLSSTLVK